MKRGKKNKTAKVISLIMTAMMLITSNSIVMASQITWQEEKNESIPGELNVESQNSSPVPELLGRVEENLESVGDITQGDIIKEETVQEVNEAEGNKAEAAEPAESLETQPQAVEIETENFFTYTKNDSDQTAVITGYNGDKSITSLTIPGEIEGCAVIEIGYEAFRSYSALETVNFPQSLVEIGDRAFSGCSALAGIVLNEGLQELGSNAFQNCSELTEIRIPSSLTAVGYSGAFGGCNKLEKVTFAYGMERHQKKSEAGTGGSFCGFYREHSVFGFVSSGL